MALRGVSLPKRMARAKPKAAKRIWLSPTGIATLDRCPRCFWLQYREGIRQPEGIVSRLANRFDEVLKRYFDLYRASGELPPMIAGSVHGKLESPFQEKYWYEHDADFGFLGKLDECLVTPDGRFTPFDFKTTSKDPATKEGILPAYQNQLDAYAFLLARAGKPPSGVGHLLFIYPEEHRTLHDRFPMRIVLETLRTDPKRAEDRFRAALDVFRGPLPNPSADCPFCLWFTRVKPFFVAERMKAKKRAVAAVQRNLF